MNSVFKYFYFAFWMRFTSVNEIKIAVIFFSLCLYFTTSCVHGKQSSIIKNPKNSENKHNTNKKVNAQQDLNTIDQYGKTPLMHAVANRQLQVIKDQVAQGADIFQVGTGGWAPIHIACQLGFLDMVQVLFQYGGVKILNQKSNEMNMYLKAGEYPLHKAVLHGHFNVTQFLLKNGARPNLTNEDMKWTPLHTLIYRGKHIKQSKKLIRLIQLLIRHGADVNQKDTYSYTVLHMAASRNLPFVVDFLVKKTNIQINAKEQSGDTALHKAARFNGLKIAQILLKKGASFTIKNKWNDTPLDQAREQGHSKMVRLLKSYQK